MLAAHHARRRCSTTISPAVTATPRQTQAAVGRDLQRREPGARRPRREVRSARRRASSPTSPRPTSSRLEEIQDNNGATDNGVVAADQTLTQADRRDRGRGRPALRLARDRPGRRPGRRPARRQHPGGVPLQPRAGDVRRPRRRRRSTGRRPARQVTKTTGKPALTLSPGRIDPTNPVWTTSRKPLVGRVHVQRQDGLRHRQPLRLQGRRPERRRPVPVPGAVVGGAAGRAGAGGARLRRADPRASTRRPTSSCSATSTTTSSARRCGR